MTGAYLSLQNNKLLIWWLSFGRFASGGFRSTKFVSSSRLVLTSILQDNLAGNVDLPSGTLRVHKALDVVWKASTIQFKVDVCNERRSCTRRVLLLMIGQTYYPSGVLDPFLFFARQLLQQTCTAKLGWNKVLMDLLGLKLRWVVLLVD